MRISDWSSDVCSSDLVAANRLLPVGRGSRGHADRRGLHSRDRIERGRQGDAARCAAAIASRRVTSVDAATTAAEEAARDIRCREGLKTEGVAHSGFLRRARSEAHTSELQSLMRSSYAVFCSIKNKTY